MEIEQNVGVGNKVVNIDSAKRSPKTAIKKPKVYESDVVNACIRWLHARGVLNWRNNTGAYKTDAGNYVRFGAKGSPDIIAIRPTDGKFCGIECKGSSGKLQPDQEAFGKKICESNGIYIVAYGLDDLERNKSIILGVS